MKKDLLTKLLLALFVVIASVSLTACGDDDDEPGQYVYTYGWEGDNSGGSSMLTDMSVVEDAYATALGVKTSPFTLTGTSQSECDAKVKAACEKAEQSLKDEVWDFTATFAVRTQSGQLVYSCSFTQGSNLF